MKASKINYLEAFSTATATATVAPTMGLLPKENMHSFTQFVVFPCNLLYNISISILHNYGQNVRDTSHRIHIQLHERGHSVAKMYVIIILAFLLLPLS